MHSCSLIVVQLRLFGHRKALLESLMLGSPALRSVRVKLPPSDTFRVACHYYYRQSPHARDVYSTSWLK